MADPTPTFRPGDVLTAETVNALIEAAGIDVRGGAGVQARRTRRGIQVTGIPQNTKYLAKATSNFAVSTSTVPSTGTADLYFIDESGPTITSLGLALPTVYCAITKAQTSTNAINSGQLCWVEQDPFGIWFIAPLECA